MQATAIVMIALCCCVLVAQDESVDSNVTERIAEYEKLRAENPKDAEVVGNLAVVYELHGHFGQALKTYQEAADLDTLEPTWPFYHALLLEQLRDLNQALAKLDQSLELDPSYVSGWLFRGKWLLDLNQPEESLVAFERALELNAGSPALEGIAMANLALGRHHEIIETWSDKPESQRTPILTRQLARALLKAGERQSARALLKNLPTVEFEWNDPRILARGPLKADSVNRSLEYSQLLAGLGQIEEAERVLRDILNEDPNQLTAVLLLSGILRSQGKDAEVTQLLTSAVARHPASYRVRTALAEVLLDNQEVDLAKDHVAKALELDTVGVEASVLQGRIHMYQRQWDDALPFLRDANERVSTKADQKVFLGITLGMLDRWEPAGELFREAIAIDPEFLPAYSYLARSQMLQRRFDDARATLNLAESVGVDESQVQTIAEQINRLEASTQ